VTDEGEPARRICNDQRHVCVFVWRERESERERGE
jgi:hypothetical protein